MSQDIKDYFHKDFQRSIVAHTIRCPSLLRHLQSGKISQSDVDSPIHKAILQGGFEILKVDSFNGEQGIPMQILALQLKSMLNAGIIYQEEKEALCIEVDMIYEMELNPSYFENILPIYISEIKLKKLIKGYKGGNAQEFASKVTQVIESSRPSEERGVVISPFIDLQLTDQPVEVVPCGISSIDSRMGGGLGKGEFGVICGISGLGKTTLAVNFCLGAAITKRVALITLEIPGPKISQRLYSRYGQLDYNRIRYGDNGNMEEVNREIERITQSMPIQIKQNYKIWDFAEKSCSLKEIDKFLTEATRNGVKPDMVFLDWLDALETDPSDRNNGFVARELRHQLQNYSKGCSDLAKKHNVAFWATTQSNASGDNKRQIRMSNSAEGFSKAWRCSVFLGIGATDQDRENGRLTVKATKMRDGAIFETQIQARLDKQTFEDVPPDLDYATPELANFTPISERNSSTN